MKKLLFIFFAASLILMACNHEPAIEPNAKFETNLIDNKAYAGETFYIYLNNCSGDFYTVYKGFSSGTTYNPDTVTAGTTVDTNLDSLAITYANAGTYKLTLVASSSGNWGEDTPFDVYTLEITVEDARTGFKSMDVGGRDAVFTDENEILFYAHKNEDISNQRTKFLTESNLATVYVGSDLVKSGNRFDFSALSPEDNEGRPVVFTVKATTGDTEDFTAKFILRDPSSEKVLYGLSSSALPGFFTVDQESKIVTYNYYSGDALQGPVLADASAGAIVRIGGNQIQASEAVANFAVETTISIEAEDYTIQDYSIQLYEMEKITAFDFTAYDPGTGSVSLSPAVAGVIDFAGRTIDIQVLPTLDLTKIVTTVTGLNTFTMKIDDVTVTSGVTEFDFSFDEPATEEEEPPTSKSFQVTVYDGTTLIDTYTLTVHI